MTSLELRHYNNHDVAVSFNDAGDNKVVVFCHGYRGTSVGPSRHFVEVEKRLAEQGISSLRFDQYGSGNSEGDFMDSSFNDWLATTKEITLAYLHNGYEVALFGQSMGAATVIHVASEIADIKGVVAWVPDPNVEDFVYPESGFIEESGQRVQASYWQEAHDARVAEKLREVSSPAYIVQCTDDEYVDELNRQAINDNAQANHEVETFEGYSHSRWTFNQAEEIIAKSVSFLNKLFER